MTIHISVKSRIRKLTLLALQAVNPGDISIRHHYTRKRFHLHSFRHRGYWFHGRKREYASMSLCERLIGPGDFVVEVGAHIGYLSTFFAQLVGPTGRVTVFEPGLNNLPYLRRNLAEFRNTRIETLALSDFRGEAPFFLEDLTGQNNTLIKDYHVAQRHLDDFGLHRVSTSTQMVQCVTGDAFFDSVGNPNIDFLKIDVEGAELAVLRGLINTLKQSSPALLIECSANHVDVMSFMTDIGYLLLNPDDLSEVRRPIGIWNAIAIKSDDQRLLPLRA
jgi:FkbM family methyltransferase